MKWYKYYKVYIALGIFFTASILVNITSLHSIFILYFIFVIVFLSLGIFGRKKFYLDNDLVKTKNEARQAKINRKREAEEQRRFEGIPHYERFKDFQKIHTKIVGGTFKNNDGSSRQEFLSELKDNEQLYLKKYSYKGAPAYYVLDSYQHCLGNLPKEIAQMLNNKYDTFEKLVYAERCYCFVPDDDYEDFDAPENNPNCIYGCEIVIYFK